MKDITIYLSLDLLINFQSAPYMNKKLFHNYISKIFESSKPPLKNLTEPKGCFYLFKWYLNELN